METLRSRVCVTGASGYIGSLLVKKLLKRGYTVHATLRNLGDESKVGLLKSLSSGVEDRLVLFQADIYNADEFEPAIKGCEFVLLVATPWQQSEAFGSKYKDTTEAAVAAVRSIMHSCEKSGTVKRVIYTGSVVAASPLREDGSGFKDFIDESCWTPLHLSFAHCGDFEKAYACSKTQSEKEILSYTTKEEKRCFEVVSLACGLVGGDSLLPNSSLSVEVIVSPFTGDLVYHKQLKFLQALTGSLPMIHIEDVCDAHMFCIEKSSISGRFLCAAEYLTMRDIVDYYEQEYPELSVIKETDGVERAIQCNSQKLVDAGFKYRHGMKQILDDSVQCMKRFQKLRT